VRPGAGFAGLGAPGLSGWFRRNRTDFEVVHIHFGRDLVVLPVALAARRHGIAYVLQTHGMVTPSDHPLAAPLDAVWTRKVLRHAAAGVWDGKVIVDIGCGPGNLFANLGGSPTTLIGVDVAKGSLEFAKELARRRYSLDRLLSSRSHT
jgi:2-polyprenyl-3-methyl-5-hydroxy-6-metoxy-1,4-benzoquinol methylase